MILQSQDKVTLYSHKPLICANRKLLMRHDSAISLINWKSILRYIFNPMLKANVLPLYCISFIAQESNITVETADSNGGHLARMKSWI